MARTDVLRNLTHFFPVGTEVSAYAQRYVGELPPTAPDEPAGEKIASGEIAEDGSLELSDLAGATSYWLHAEGHGSVKVLTDAEPEA